MNKKLKLNLGCGIIYKPGYINIDKFDNSVADMVRDVDDLPFDSNSVDIIEANHIIEHFDYIHCLYVLSDWFRILKPDGTLVLETPDLEKSFKKLMSSNFENQQKTLQWIYGIDNPGMQHKTGFTFDFLKNLLEQIGFEKISREEAKTHLYEPGIRITCKKSKNCTNKQFIASFRKKLKTITNDSESLISLENFCIKEILDTYFEEYIKNKKIEVIDKIISKSAICNPRISLIFIEELIKANLIDKDDVKEKIRLINYLIKMNFHKRLFSLWIKNKKVVGKTDENFNDFIKHLESLIESVLEKGDYEEQLEYISNLKAVDIKIFNINTAQFEARKLFNIAVKEFHEKNLAKSLDSMLQSIKINPENPLAHWSLARLKVALKSDKEAIKGDYENALMLMKNKQNRKIIKKELDYLNNKKLTSIPTEPVSEEYQII